MASTHDIKALVKELYSDAKPERKAEIREQLRAVQITYEVRGETR